MQLPLLIRLLAYAGHLLWRLSTRCQFRVHLSRRQSIRRLLLRLGPSVSGCRGVELCGGLPVWPWRIDVICLFSGWLRANRR